MPGDAERWRESIVAATIGGDGRGEMTPTSSGRSGETSGDCNPIVLIEAVDGRSDHCILIVTLGVYNAL
jgi:hypothetical protein